MEQSARERPITYASIPKEPEQVKEETGTELDTAAPSAAAPPAVYYLTRTRLYVQSTGAETGFASGTVCHIKGQITSAGEPRMVDMNLPEKTNFANQNGGLGV